MIAMQDLAAATWLSSRTAETRLAADLLPIESFR